MSDRNIEVSFCVELDEQLQIVDQFIKTISKHYSSPIVTEISLSSEFLAEQYHQNYFQNNQSNRYCTVVIEPKLKKLKNNFLPSCLLNDTF